MIQTKLGRLNLMIQPLKRSDYGADGKYAELDISY